MIKKSAVFLIFSILFNIFSSVVHAEEGEKYITIVNPVRISRYTTTPVESLKSEYKVVKKHGFPATWLLTYDALNNEEIISETKKMDTNQEFGVFLEITPTLASIAGVEYHESGSWHHANSVFLSGYTQEERIKLIDKVFDKFNQEFEEYPKSVGSWWTDSFSLSYIKGKYGIVANLVCSDQFSTDGYKIWGQPWQVAYYPSKLHAAVPASDINNKLDLINLQWASRDPLNGYMSSLYSTQDYLVSESVLDISYFEKLINLYLNGDDIGQITVGLEADLDPAGYSGEFLQQMDVVKKYLDEGVKVVTMSEFYDVYREKYPNISPSTQIESKDLLGKDIEAVWYNSPFYRLHYTKDTINNVIQIKDIRVYDKNLIDPYLVSPNYEFNLSINIPSIIDTVQNPEDVWILPSNTEIITNDNSFIIKGKNIKIPNRIKKDSLINLIVNKNEIEVNFNPITFNNDNSDIIKGYTSETIHFLKSKKSIINLLIGKDWENIKKMDYLIPQNEIYALSYLKSLPQGKVMVFDKECLQCSWHTMNKPIVFANLRSYIKKYSKHPIVYNSSVFKAKTIEDAQKEFKKVNAKYVYLVKFENYAEKLPFSPGDLGIEKIYSNANAEVWEVEK